MTHGAIGNWLGLLVLAGSASATTVGPLQGRPVAGHPLEVNIPFAVDAPADRACAVASARYGNAQSPRVTLHVQGHGLKRNLLLTSRANVSEPMVTVNVRVGCGSKAVSRRFVLLADMPVARSAAGKPVAEISLKPAPKPVAVATPSEPLFPPPAAPQPVPPPDAEELRKARSDAATAIAQLEGTRKELVALLDVERRTSQTLINADHQVADAKSEVARMRMVLMWVGAALALAAAGVVWFEFKRVALRRFLEQLQPVQDPGILSSAEVPT